MSAATQKTAVPADQSLTALEALIKAHAEAAQISGAKWEAAADIEDAIKDRLPIVRVQVGRLLRMQRDDNGQDLYDPIYKYDEDDIEKFVRQHTDAMLGVWARGTNAEKNRETIFQKHRASVQKLTAELAAIQAEHNRIEVESGYAAAREAAKEASRVTYDLEKQITSFVPATLAAASRLAAWIVEGLNEKFPSNLDEDDAIEALSAIAAAGLKGGEA